MGPVAAHIARGWVGAALCGAGAAVVAAAGATHPGARTAPVLALLGAVVAAGVAGRLLAAVAGWLPPLAVGVAAVATVPSFAGDAGRPDAPPLGYANADAALFAVGGLAALAVVLSPHPPAAARALAAGSAGVLLPATVLTRSAAGTALLLLGAALVALARGSRRLAASAAVGVLVVAAAGTTLAAALHPGDLRGRSIGSRVALWRDALRIAVDRPLLGVGPGGFEGARTVTADPDLRWAHHGFLQAVAELGVAGGVLLAAAAAWALVRAARAPGPAGAAALAATFAVAVHACFDHVLHDPAVVVPVAVLVGAARPAEPGTSAAEAAARPCQPRSVDSAASTAVPGPG